MSNTRDKTREVIDAALVALTAIYLVEFILSLTKP
jgi:hypothetical protein